MATVNIIIIAGAAVLCTALVCHAVIRCRAIASDERIALQESTDRRMINLLRGRTYVSLRPEEKHEREE